MKHLFLLFSFVLVLSTCGDDEMVIDPYTQELALDIVTGLQTRDANAAPVGMLGNPNVFSGQVDTYPVPAINTVNVQYFGGSNLQIMQYWIFAANATTEYADINYQQLLGNGVYSPDEVSELNILQTSTVNLSSFALDLSDLDPGYYRIFYLLSNEQLLWDNLYIDPSATDFSTLLSTVSADW